MMSNRSPLPFEHEAARLEGENAGLRFRLAELEADAKQRCVINRTTPHESRPLLERTMTVEGILRELEDFHELRTKTGAQ